jgi:hypothetical protein
MAVNYVGVGVCLGPVIRQCRRPRTLPALLRSPKRRQLFGTRPSCQGNAAVDGETLQPRTFPERCCRERMVHYLVGTDLRNGTARSVHRF